ncbi:MAG TPA: two-component regulator propeller domain-containing protein, partial [Chryseosolibacter sp.]|nr:two-component regulator propeller domain-containing protein [Chryseosolibacter sp.]
VANYGGNQPLHLLNSDGSWASFSFAFPNEQRPTDLSVDARGNPWMALNPASGGGLIVWDRDNNQAYYKTDAGGNGNLPDKNVNCITTDRTGYTWVGTDAGVAYFFSVSEDAIKPIYENRFLLRDEKITAIEADAGNRKWIGTEQGVWLFNPTGEVLVHHFTRENSPLLSNIIRDIEIHATTGEVFFATDQGIISYRSDATAPSEDFENLTIFPNPVSPGYNGMVGITGLAENAFVRITDIGGKLIWQTQANGGMATWNVRDHEGRRASTGIYLVFTATEDGRESVVGKIAVIE